MRLTETRNEPFYYSDFRADVRWVTRTLWRIFFVLVALEWLMAPLFGAGLALWATGAYLLARVTVWFGMKRARHHA